MMDKYTVGELAYKNGYEKGFADGVASSEPKYGFWKWTKDGTRVCSHCGMPEPNCIPGDGAIYDHEKNYCYKCGARLIYPEEQ